MAKPNILVVDSDEGFGTMLAEGLQDTGYYTANCVDTGSKALETVIEHNFDLVIIDVALSDMKPANLVKAIRDAKDEIKIMLIPMLGQQLPQSLASLDINGVLPKPFFVGDLPELVDKALGRTRERTPTPAPTPVSQTAAVQADSAPSGQPVETSSPVIAAPTVHLPAVPQETIRFLRASETEILRLLDDLNREVRAEAILLIAGSTLIAQAGMLSREECEELSVLVGQSTHTASHAASFLGERAGRFTQSLHEGAAYRLYTLSLAEGILLSLALSMNTPLGMIRHQSRQIAEQLTKFII